MSPGTATRETAYGTGGEEGSRTRMVCGMGEQQYCMPP